MPICELIQKNFAWSQWGIKVNQTTMKTKLFVLCTMLCAMLFAGCEPNEPATSNKVVTGDVTDITRSSALFHGTVNVDISAYNNVEFGIMIAETKEELNAREGEMYEADILIGKGFKLDIYYLSPATSYYYCAWLLLNNTQYEFGNIKEFQTLGASEPMVTTSEATQISLRTATIGGNVTDNGGSEVVERGICYSTSANPSISSKKIVCGSGLGEFTCDLTDLEKNTKYYVRAYAINSIGISYGNEIKFTTLDKIQPKAIDLGLSVKWATMNIGAESPEDTGEVFTWGDIVPVTFENIGSGYKWSDGTENGMTKYNLVDGKEFLESEDDAATVNWGGTWRMPTAKEIDELIDNCTIETTIQNGVKGIIVTGKNGNSIFIPGIGYRYWSNQRYENKPEGAYGFSPQSNCIYDFNFGNRKYGNYVRPVCQ